MIAFALRAHIESYASTSMRTRNALFTRALKGTLTQSHLTRYLSNVRYLVAHTPIHLARAKRAAERAGDLRLAAHYAAKIGEEEGHDAWAERDLARLGARPSAFPRSSLATMTALVTFIESVIDEDPALYLAYILFAEYLIVLLGPEWLALLESRCGIPRSAMTVIGNHAELDRDHVEEAIDVIDDLVGDPSKLTRMRAVLDDTIAHFERFSTEVTENEHVRARSIHPTNSSAPAA